MNVQEFVDYLVRHTRQNFCMFVVHERAIWTATEYVQALAVTPGMITRVSNSRSIRLNVDWSAKLIGHA